jgi:hypothetical protein
MLQGFVVKQRLTGSQLFFMINYYSAYLGVPQEIGYAVFRRMDFEADSK